jgi:hypothetical protein
VVDYEAMVTKDKESAGGHLEVKGAIKFGDLGPTLDPPKSAAEKARVVFPSYSVPVFRGGYARLVEIARKSPVPERAEAAKQAIAYIQQRVKCNGDWLTLHMRWLTGLGQPGMKPLSGYMATRAARERLLTMWPVQLAACQEWPDRFQSNDYRRFLDFDMTKHANLGLPVNRPRDHPSAVGPMRKIYQLFANVCTAAGLRDLIKSHPILFVALRKPKTEDYLVSELQGPRNKKLKTRPIYVLNGCLSHIFSALMKPLMLASCTFLISPKHRLAGFPGYVQLPCGWWYHPTSTFGVGFSWMYGGAEALVEAMEYFMEHSVTGDVRFISYADDQLIWRHLGEDLWVYVPDARQMDANMEDTVAAVFADFYRESLPFVRGTILELWLTYYQMKCVNGPVMLDHGLVVNQKQKLISGVPGTTLIDQQGSNLAALELMNLNTRPSVRALNPQAWITEMGKQLTEKRGLEWKPDTMAPHRYERGKDLDAAFLGYGIRAFVHQDKQYYVPKTNPLKLVNNYHKSSPRVQAGDFAAVASHQLTRLYQFVALGLYQDPVWYAWAQEEAVALKRSNAVVVQNAFVQDEDGQLTCDLDCTVIGFGEMEVTDFPSIEKCLSYSVVPHKVPIDLGFVATSDEEMFGFGEYVPMKWADEVKDPAPNSIRPDTRVSGVTPVQTSHLRRVQHVPPIERLRLPTFEEMGISKAGLQGFFKKYTEAQRAERQAAYLQRKAMSAESRDVIQQMSRGHLKSNLQEIHHSMARQEYLDQIAEQDQAEWGDKVALMAEIYEEMERRGEWFEEWDEGQDHGPEDRPSLLQLKDWRGRVLFDARSDASEPEEWEHPDEPPPPPGWDKRGALEDELEGGGR